MNKYPLRRVAPGDADWIGHYVELQLKDLREEPLTEEEQDFLDEVALAAMAVPDALEGLILARALNVAEAIDSDEDELSVAAPPPMLCVAASTSPRLFDALRMAVEQGMKHVAVDADGSALPVLRIDIETGLAEACYQDGYTFIISRRGAQPETVTPLGGVFVALSALKTMTLTYDSGSKTISLSEA
jgi:hypothetical protein